MTIQIKTFEVYHRDKGHSKAEDDVNEWLRENAMTKEKFVDLIHTPVLSSNTAMSESKTIARHYITVVYDDLQQSAFGGQEHDSE